MTHTCRNFCNVRFLHSSSTQHHQHISDQMCRTSLKTNFQLKWLCQWINKAGKVTHLNRCLKKRSFCVFSIFKSASFSHVSYLLTSRKHINSIKYTVVDQNDATTIKKSPSIQWFLRYLPPACSLGPLAFCTKTATLWDETQQLLFKSIRIHLLIHVFALCWVSSAYV